jgi:hypothetical protein
MATQLKDLTVQLEDKPGTLATAAEALGKAGINIEGICGFSVQGKSLGHILVENAANARRALESAGARVTEEKDVLVTEIEDRPGSLGKLTRKIAGAGVNLNLVYLATNTRLVIGADNLAKARGAIEGATAGRS